ncbi:MAG: glutamine amidotransferase [Planctomycetota bacterium]
MTPASDILYAGDTTLTTAASYLAGVVTHAELGFDYLAGDEPIASRLADRAYGLYILSDYPVNNIRPTDAEAIAEAVAAGAGLLMIGGWESFHGLGGDYHRSRLADVLPVTMLDEDDRVNSATPCVIEPAADHPIIDGLPWGAPPTIGGYNRIAAKDDARTVLRARHLDVTVESGRYRFAVGQAAPLLIVGAHRRGRTAALATDVAPHWVGGFVDWGAPRVAAQAPGASEIEVGRHYADFFARLVRWTLGRPA